MGGVKIQGVVIKLYLHDVICMRCSDRRMREGAITEEEAQAKAHHTSRLNQHEDPTLENALYCKRLAIPDRAEIW